MTDKSMKRMAILLLLVAAMPLALAQGDFDWARFSGSTVTVLMPEHPVLDGIDTVLEQFEQDTGITVNIESMAENLYFDRMELALRAEQGVADVYFLPMDSTAFTQWSAGLIKPLTPYLEDPSMTAADYDFADFPAGFLMATQYPPSAADKEDFGIPASFEAYTLFYNKDIIDQYLGGEVPDTMDGLIAAAKSISEQSGGTVAGAVMRGIRSHTIMDTVTGMVFNAFGADPVELPYNVWFDGDWANPRLTDERVATGLSHYAGMMSAGPANIQALDWPDASLLFSQGLAGFFIDASLFGPGFEDESASVVAGRVGYRVIPPVSEGGASLTGHWMWGYGIPANSQNPEAAWYFIQYISNKDNAAQIGAFHGGATRLSTWDEEAYTSSLNAEYVATVQEAMQSSRTTVVFREGWSEYALAIVDAIQGMFAGDSPEAAAASAQEQVLKLVGESQ
ncbi:MAG: extracellular solute-binding protein [Trueperaceae bacterium]|nr:MAG: extracellular solute-binding protein [Trueperaceae bacterium]